jgi:type IV secretory pathway VirB2 component (pilin)
MAMTNRRRVRSTHPSMSLQPPTRRRRVVIAAASALTAILLLPGLAYGAGAGGGAAMPWTGPLQTLLDNLSGPTARIVAGLGFVIGGGVWAFSRSEEGAKRFGQIVIGAAIAIGAANIVTSLAFVGAVV